VQAQNVHDTLVDLVGDIDRTFGSYCLAHIALPSECADGQFRRLLSIDSRTPTRVEILLATTSRRDYTI